MRGSASSARAIEISWRSPADRPEPPSRTAWSRPPLTRAATRSTPTAAAAASTSASGRVGLAEADVRGDRAAEEERVLEHDAELAAVRAERDVAQVDAVDANGARVGVVEAADEPGERRLAAARLADERETAARGHGDLDAVQHRLLAVRERHVVDREVALDARQHARVLALADLRLLIEDRGDLHHRCRARLELPVHVGELLQRLEHELQQIERGDQRPDGERVVREQRRARVEHRARRDRRRGTRSTGRRSRRSSACRRSARGSPRSARRTAPGSGARG